MTQALYLFPALLGAVCLLAVGQAPASRRIVGGSSIAGIGCGLAIFFSRDGAESWRTTSAHPAATAIVGIAIACAWVLVWAVHRDDGGYPGALTGVASSALVLAATNDWVVPMLIFWTTASVALGVVAARDTRRVSVWACLFSSDAAWIGTIAWLALDAETWRFDLSLTESARWLVIAAVVLRAGVIPGVGVWGAISRRSAAAIPLVVAGAFVILVRVEIPVHAGVAVGLLGLGVAASAVIALRRKADTSAAPSWVAAVMVSSCFVAPQVVARAGIALVLIATVAALWEWTTSGARVWRAALLGLAPITAGFGVIVSAALVAFDRAASAREVVDAAPWTAIGGLLPVAVGLGIVMAVRVARLLEPPVHAGWETLATWGLFATAVGIGIIPIAGIGVPGGMTGPAVRPLVLHVVALLSAGVVGWVVHKRNRHVATRNATGTARSRAPIPRRFVAVILSALALVFLLTSVAATGWLTVRGLLVGFL